MTKAIKKPQSSYLIYCNEKRKEVMNLNPGVRIGDIQKIISKQWNALKSEEKGIYVELAIKDKARYQQELLDTLQVNEKPIATADHSITYESNACIYPIGRVRKIVQSDPDVGKVSKDALVAIAKASELFAQFLGTKSYEQAMYRNKRQIKASDVTRTIQTTASLDWLREDFPIRAEVVEESKVKKDKKVLPDSASFFKTMTIGKTNGTLSKE
ncbi:unnamed protein product [Peronospora belbahrii]|uniref:HMG box domain-containing protein n=1 Tax=Peronospora belbahrii TaxID=622444 RepID=A0AAU9KKL2_9STRA|nr:unnamed protein product [Peronospora belbahrii]CAH0519536.1 unnamed protein product [Peronospora belbahrii]